MTDVILVLVLLGFYLIGIATGHILGRRAQFKRDMADVLRMLALFKEFDSRIVVECAYCGNELPEHKPGCKMGKLIERGWI